MIRPQLSLRERLTQNLGLKAVALLAAIVLFALVRGAEEGQMSVDVPVIMTPPAIESGKMLVSDVPDRVRVFLQGSRSQLGAVRADAMSVTVDLTDTTAHYYYFADDQFALPAGVRINRIAPASFPLEWSDRAERRVRLEARLTGVTPEGTILAAPPQVEPGEVLVVGPADRLNDLRAVYTQPIDLSLLDVGEHVRRVPLERIDDTVTFEPSGPVRVQVVIEVELSERELLAPVRVDGAEARVVPEQVRVTLRGPSSVLDVFEPADLQAVVMVRGEPREPTASLPTTFPGLPRGIQVVRVEPASVTLTFR